MKLLTAVGAPGRYRPAAAATNRGPGFEACKAAIVSWRPVRPGVSGRAPDHRMMSQEVRDDDSSPREASGKEDGGGLGAGLRSARKTRPAHFPVRPRPPCVIDLTAFFLEIHRLLNCRNECIRLELYTTQLQSMEIH